MYQIDYNKQDFADKIASSILRDGIVGRAIPKKVARDMVKLIPEEWFEPKPSELTASGSLDKDIYKENHRVLDLCCNSGILLYQFLGRFKYALTDYSSGTFDTDDAIYEYILKELLYGVCSDGKLCKEIRGMLYNNPDVYGNIYNINALSGVGADEDMFKIKDGVVYIYNPRVKELEEMKFDVVCGNPPYNKDLYLEFVVLGHNLSKSYDLWITPAKFMGMANRVNKEFRKGYLRYISDVIYYPESFDIFDVLEACGLAIYLMDKSEHSLVNIENKCDFVPLLKSGKVSRNISKVTTLLNIGAELISKIYDRGFKFVDFDGDFNVWVTNMPGYGGGSTSKHFFSNDRNAQIIQRYEILGRDEIYSAQQSKVVFSSNNRLECENFVSFLYSKFVRFLVYCGFCSTNPLNNATFRFVPAIIDFSVVYEDSPLDGYIPDENGYYTDNSGVVHCSLYARYKLTPEEINIIESVIRKRS